MANQDWYNLGEDIRNMVQSAIDSKDFRQLNESVNRSIHTAMENVSQGLRQAGDIINEASQKASPQNPWRNQRWKESSGRTKTTYRAPQRTLALYKSTTGMTAAGFALAICGYTLMAGLGIGCLSVFLVGLFDSTAGGQCDYGLEGDKHSGKAQTISQLYQVPWQPDVLYIKRAGAVHRQVSEIRIEGCKGHDSQKNVSAGICG